MKTCFLSLFLVGAALTATPLPMAQADDISTLAAPAGSTNAASGTAPAAPQGQRMERLKEALAELDLTDAQKAQIKQIRASVTDHKERRQQIMAVLTPDQKDKLLAMWQAHKEAAGTGAGSANSEQ